MKQSLIYKQLRIKEIEPKGWMYNQLKIQANGLCGNLDKVWPDIRDSRWIGGKEEGWERVPYWLDGFISLAWLLNNADFQQRANQYIDAILMQQQEDGWICPCGKEARSHYDIWAAFLICKVLVLYYDCTEDTRIEQAIYDALKCILRHLELHTLFDWGAARWFECLIPLGWLYDRRPEKWMLELAVMLRVQGIDYEGLFENWQYQEPQEFGRWNYLTHVVNLSMCLKSDSLNSAFWGKDAGDFAEKALKILTRDHGLPTGHFSGDECLAGKSPLSGTELCGVVEAMYSCEWILGVTGEDAWAEQLEAIAFNALPATISSDMWTHQYDQMTNQVECSILSPEHTHFRTNSGESHIFGLEPNYGCCTANMGQGWPKLMLSAVLRSRKGLAIGAILPCSITTKIDGVQVCCEIVTDYPFGDEYRVIIKTERPVAFELSLRIPKGANKATVNDKAVEEKRYRIDRIWDGRNEVVIKFDFEVELLPQCEGLYFAKRGPLVFSLPIKAEWRSHEYIRNGVERLYPYCDYELYPHSSWNFAFTGSAFKYVKEITEKLAFSSIQPPIKLRTRLCPVDWPFENGKAALKPHSCTPVGKAVDVELVPYGCTDLRMTVMPVADKKIILESIYE